MRLFYFKKTELENFVKYKEKGRKIIENELLRVYD